MTVRKTKFVYKVALLTLIVSSVLGCQSVSTNLQVADTTNVFMQSNYRQQVSQEVQALNDLTNEGNLTNEQEAKVALLQAISTHLNTDHVAVMQSRQQDAPFAPKGSIDYGANSFYRTFIENLNRKYEQDKLVPNDSEEEMSDSSSDELDDNQLYKDNSRFSKYLNENKVTTLQRIIDFIHLTPEQIQAKNLYQNQYFSVSSIQEYNNSKRQINSVYSIDYQSPTLYSSMQFPIGLDFDNGTMLLDPSAIMPLIATIDPEHAPLPQDMTSSLVKFELPESIDTSILPPSVFYDVFIDALQKSMSELDSSNFTPVDISQDAYAKKVGARSAVKVNLGGKQTGQMIGTIIKHMGDGFDAYIAANPERFGNDVSVLQFREVWYQASDRFQTDDIGALIQLIEAVAPIDFNNTTVYYLDGSLDTSESNGFGNGLDGKSRLIAKQVRTNIGSDITGVSTTLISQTHYDQGSFNTHRLSSLFNESFGSNALPAMDGNRWLQQIKEHKDKLRQAENARENYFESSESDITDCAEQAMSEDNSECYDYFYNDADNGYDDTDDDYYSDIEEENIEDISSVDSIRIEEDQIF